MFCTSSDPVRQRMDYQDRQDHMSAADSLADKSNRFRLAPIPAGFQPVAVVGGFELVNEVGHKILAADGRPFSSVEKAVEAGEAVAGQLKEISSNHG